MYVICSHSFVQIGNGYMMGLWSPHGQEDLYHINANLMVTYIINLISTVGVPLRACCDR
jgi:hypothetical protein